MKLTRDQWQAKLGQAMANAASLPVHKPISQEERNELTFELLLGTEDKAWQAILLLRQNGYRGKEMAEAVNKVFQLGNEERLSLEMVRGVLDESEKRKATGPKLRLALEELLRSTLPADCLDAATVSRALRSAALKRREIARAEYETQPSQEFKEKAQKKLEEIKALGLDLDCVRRWTCKGGRAKKQATEGTNTRTTTSAENSDATQSPAEQSAGQVKSKPVTAPASAPKASMTQAPTGAPAAPQTKAPTETPPASSTKPAEAPTNAKRIIYGGNKVDVMRTLQGLGCSVTSDGVTAPDGVTVESLEAWADGAQYLEEGKIEYKPEAKCFFVHGNTFKVKEDLRKLGLRFDQNFRLWGHVGLVSAVRGMQVVEAAATR